MRRSEQRKRASIAARPDALLPLSGLGVENRDDLKRSEIHHHDLVTHKNELISTPIRIDGHDFRRQRVERHVARNAAANHD